MSPALSERDAWICLAAVDGVGEETLPLLVSQFRSANEVLEAARDGRVQAWNRLLGDQIGRVPINAPTMADLVLVATDPAARLADAGQLGLWVLTALDADYPPRLRDLDPPPAVIYGLGERENLTQPRQVAVVGTRRPTPAGRVLAGRIATRLVEHRAVVVSGLAIGIDGAAHAAVIDHEGRTVGVIGAGHRFPGPRAHQRLRDAVVDSGGTLISEHHPKVKPAKGTFPRRNRIIAALGDATIVVEAPHKSGALITARRALEMGRPVFAAPGRVGDWSVAGSLALLRDTPALAVVGLDELVEDLGYLAAPPHDSPRDAPAQPLALLQTLGEPVRVVAERLRAGPVGLDVLVADTGLPPGVVSSAVTLLLMRGWAQSIGPAFVAAGPLLS